MQTRSSSRLTRNKSSKQKVENSNLEEHLPPVVTMADNRTMAELLRAPIEGYAEAIVVPSILAEQFELKHNLINMMTKDQFFGLEKDNPHDHIRAARRWLEKEPPRSITTREDLLSKFINEFFPPSRTTSLRGNLLERSTQDVLTIIENKSKVRNSRSKPLVSQVKSYDDNSNSEIAKLTHAVNQQTSAVTTAMTAMLKQFQATPPPALVKAIEEICITCGAQQNQNFHLNEMEKIKRINEANMKAMQTQIDIVKNELRNEMKISIQTSLSNQTNKIKNMMASLLQMNTASTSISGTLPSNTVTNPKGNLKSITTRSGVSYDGPSIPPPVVENEPEATKDTVNPTNNGNTEDVQPQVVQSNPVTFEPANTPFASTLKALIENKEKLSEMARTSLYEHCSAVLLKKLPEKLGDLGKFLIPCDFPGMAKCLALADLGASINSMPYSVWKKLSLPELTPTCMTLEPTDRLISTLVRVAEDVYVKVGSFHFPTDFIVVDFNADPRVPLILGRSFLKTGRALIDVFEGELTLRVGKEAITFNLDQTSRVQAAFLY
uniref:Reverse transcriptase domain-containing protein n=1 Tax=Tanacetum cinerariifolium TaxID=118510 RepID=A0A6L2JJG8_TANCI|nr:reverse transcriptase domain-containing protein [Tanacetum cinerariifolium]